MGCNQARSLDLIARHIIKLAVLEIKNFKQMAK